jgi:hypothetical protein
MSLPLLNALLFSLSGAFFIALCLIRWSRDRAAARKN